MIKVILLDGDGVVLKQRDKYFSQRFFEEKAPPHLKIDDILEFYKNEYQLCARGKENLKKELAKYVEKWGWKGTMDELLDYWYSYENVLDDEVLSVVKQLKEKGITCCIASDHTKYRADNLMQDIGLQDYFDEAFFSAYVGYTKSEREYFESVLKTLRDKYEVEPTEVMFWDDDAKNVELAKSFGIEGYVFTTFEDFQFQLKEKGLI